MAANVVEAGIVYAETVQGVSRHYSGNALQGVSGRKLAGDAYAAVAGDLRLAGIHPRAAGDFDAGVASRSANGAFSALAGRFLPVRDQAARLPVVGAGLPSLPSPGPFNDTVPAMTVAGAERTGQVAKSAFPEFATWLLLLLGFALVGMGLRGRGRESRRWAD